MSISNIKEYTQQFGMFGEPIEYNGLNIYPILVKDAYALDEHINILNIEKKKFGIEAIQQSYLYFMVCFMMEIPASIKSFLWIVEKVLHIEYDESIVIEGFERGEILAKDDEDDDSVVLLINGYPIAFELNGRKASIFFGDVKLNATQFDEWRKIILYQNYNGYDDRIISDDVAKIIEQYNRARNQGVHEPTLEDKMLVVLTSTNETRESIKNMPYRQFERLFDMAVRKVEYATNKILLPNMENKDIEHWVYRKETDPLAKLFSSADSVGKMKER